LSIFFNFAFKVFQTNIKHKLVQFILNLPIRGKGMLAMGLARLLFPKLSGEKQIPTLYGFDLILQGTDDVIIERSVYYTGTYEKGTLHVIGLLLQPGSVFIDAGANIGLMSLYAASKVGKQGKVFAFEPFPKIYDRLLANIKLNEFNQIQSFPVALGSKAGEGLLYPNTKYNPGASSLIQTNAGGDGVRVPVDVLDKIVSDNQLVDVLKIDVEGFELEVLKGAQSLLKRETAPALIVECSAIRENYGYTTDELFNFITTINRYQIYTLKRGKGSVSALQGVKHAEDLPDHDNLFCLLPHHLNRVFK
jgi:FkbM family methyltransferase